MLEIIKILLPIATALIIGMCCRKFDIIDKNALDRLKKLLFDIIVPVVLFNSFISADYSIKSFVYVISIIIPMLIIYLLASVSKKYIFKSENEYFPETVSLWEGGTIGISLCTLLLGTFGLQQMAIFDFGHALLLFTIIVPIIKFKDGVKLKGIELVKMIFSSKTLIAVILGGILGIMGAGKFIANNVVANVLYHGITDIIISPVNFFIILIVGYMINFKMEMIGKIIKLCLFRLAFMGIACLMSCLIIFSIIPFDKEVFIVLLIAYSLPPTFALGIFTSFKNDEKKEELYSDVTSFYVIINLILFATISAYYLGNR